MTEFIRIDVDIDYPVGECIDKNLGEANKMANALCERFPNVAMTFWVTGSSGAIIAALVCAKVGMPTKIIYIKKPGEDNHHTDDHPQPLDKSINVIIDDFTRSFDTVRRILRGVRADGFTPDCLCLGGSLHGLTMKEESNSFPVIIASRIYFPDLNTIDESGEYDIKDLADKIRVY